MRDIIYLMKERGSFTQELAKGAEKVGFVEAGGGLLVYVVNPELGLLFMTFGGLKIWAGRKFGGKGRS